MQHDFDFLRRYLCATVVDDFAEYINKLTPEQSRSITVTNVCDTLQIPYWLGRLLLEQSEERGIFRLRSILRCPKCQHVLDSWEYGKTHRFAAYYECEICGERLDAADICISDVETGYLLAEAPPAHDKT